VACGAGQVRGRTAALERAEARLATRILLHPTSLSITPLSSAAFAPHPLWNGTVSKDRHPQPRRFDDARAAYRSGGRPDLAQRLLEGLAEAAVRQRRFGDAAHTHYRLAMDALQVCLYVFFCVRARVCVCVCGYRWCN
jgi:hypothetical protein